MRIMHVALGGCLSGTAIRFGATEDTGGHLAYVLGAAGAQARRGEVHAVDIVTRAFEDPGLGPSHAETETPLDVKRRILRIRGDRRDYLEKGDLEGELPALTASFLDLLERGPRPDVIHAHFADAAVLALAARRAFGIPFFYSAHSLALQGATDSTGTQARIARETDAIRQADAIVVSSRDEAECQIGAYHQHAAGRVHRIPPGVRIDPGADVGAAQRLIAPFLRAPTRPILLAIARPVEKKNLGALVEAYGASPALQEAANLVILAGQRNAIGAAATEAERVTTDLFDRVDRLGLWGRVALPRSHAAEDVQSLYALAARGGVFVNPAHHEPFGLTIVEAARHGVPVVATRNGGPAEILETVGYGRAVDPHDRESLIAACLAILDDPLRDVRSAEACRIATRVFDWDRWAERVSGVVRDIVGRAQRSAATCATPERLFVSDIDGTLTGDRAGIARFRDWLKAHPRTAFAVATGRCVPEARRVLAEWRLPEPRWIIAAVGSEIWRADGRGGYRLDEGYADRLASGWQRALVWAVLQTAGAWMQPDHAQRAFKLSAFGDAAEAARLDRHLQRKGLRARVVASHGRFIDILPPNAGKARAAGWLARYLRLTAEDCIAAGDSGNDRDLLQWAGAAILPANALPELDDLAAPSICRMRAAHICGVLEGLEMLHGAPALHHAAAAG